MEQISNVKPKGYYPTYPYQKTPQQHKYATNNIKNGDKKSIDILSWIGKVAIAGVAIAGFSAAITKGKGIDSSLIDMEKFTNEGVAVLTENGQKLNKLKKLLFNVAEDGTIRSGKIISQNGNETISTLIRNGKKIAVETSTTSTKGIKKILQKEIYDGEKLTRKITKNKDIVYIYGDNGIITELIKQKNGKKIERIANITQKIEGQEPLSFSFIPRKGEKINSTIQNGTAYSIGKIKKGRTTTEVYRIINNEDITEFAVITSGKKRKIVYKGLDAKKNKFKTYTKKIISDNDFRNKFEEASSILYNQGTQTYSGCSATRYDDFMDILSGKYDFTTYDLDSDIIL